MPFDFDVIVIGSGAGGATFAYACAAAKKSVLLVERGGKQEAHACHDELATLIEKRPYDDREVQMNGQPRRLYTGGVLGGGTALYGAALMRPSVADFQPGRSYGRRIPHAIWDWPISYATLAPFYTEAERLYGVAGSSEDDFGPLEKPLEGFPKPALPLRPINKKLMSANVARGLRPFRLPLAIDSERCLQCGSCAGYLCPNGARHSGAHLLDLAANGGSRLQVLTRVEVESFCKDDRGEVAGVRVRERATGKVSVYRGHRYGLAAGAIGSPALLLRSGIDGPHVGRNYMYHLSPIAAGIFLRNTGADAVFAKQVGFADYYFGTKQFAHKLGMIQSLPVPGPLMVAKAGNRRLPPRLVNVLRKKMLPMTGIVEDLPNPANRVTVGTDGAAAVSHAFAPYDVERGQQLGLLMKQILKSAGAIFSISKPFPSDEHVAHQCGTLRFGKQPGDAALDPDCRLFTHPNVFVVDGSFFPTSLGVGPALTIMANALRVARVAVTEA
jgi:choline dehydrogenase-like flavoprotein